MQNLPPYSGESLYYARLRPSVHYRATWRSRTVNTMSNPHARNHSRKPAGLAATILFVLVVGMGYAISRQVEGAVGLPDAVEDQDTAPLPSECTVGGLTFSDCFLDF